MYLNTALTNNGPRHTQCQCCCPLQALDEAELGCLTRIKALKGQYKDHFAELQVRAWGELRVASRCCHQCSH